MTALYLALGIALTSPLLAFSVRRMLGLRLPLLRTLIAGVIAYLVASPTVTAIIPKHSGFLPDLWFVILGYTIALLIGMCFLVVAEVFVPSGSLPGPLYLVRGLRNRLARTKRYAQVGQILARRGVLPYMRGGRRAGLRTPDGRAHLARSLRLAFEDGGVTFIKLGQLAATRRDLDHLVEQVPHLLGDAVMLVTQHDNGRAAGWDEISEAHRVLSELNTDDPDPAIPRRGAANGAGCTQWMQDGPGRVLPCRSAWR
jgi:hypothetical protein